MKFIIDCDPGNGVNSADIDDAVAIALAAEAPDVELELVTVVAGNTPLPIGYSSGRHFMDTYYPSVPVVAGHATPLRGDSGGWRKYLDARRDEPRVQQLWEGTERAPERPVPVGDDASGRIIQAVRGSDEKPYLFGIGPLTNIASAILRDPGIVDEVERIVVMGGAFDVPTLPQELNFGQDPEAAHVVLTSGADVLLVPFDATARTLFRTADMDALAQSSKPVARYLASVGRPWLEMTASRYGLDGFNLHDPLAIAAILDPDIIDTELAQVDVELVGTLTRGRPVRWHRDEMMLWPDLARSLPDIRPVEIVTQVDNARLVSLLLRTLGAPE